MRKNLIKLSVVALVLVAFFACGKSGGTPEEVVKQYFKALANENWSAAKKLSTESTHQFIDFMENAMKMSQMAGQKPEKKDGKIEDIECKIEEEFCYCTFLVDGENENLKLVKVDGKWLVEQAKEMPGFNWD